MHSIRRHASRPSRTLFITTVGHFAWKKETIRVGPANPLSCFSLVSYHTVKWQQQKSLSAAAHPSRDAARWPGATSLALLAARLLKPLYLLSDNHIFTCKQSSNYFTDFDYHRNSIRPFLAMVLCSTHAVVIHSNTSIICCLVFFCFHVT